MLKTEIGLVTSLLFHRCDSIAVRRSRPRPDPKRLSLYDRLGGVYTIATVVDDLMGRIMIDPRLNANPLAEEAHHRVPPAGFKCLVTEMVCWATGGPQKYTGKPMAESHKDLKITGVEWGGIPGRFSADAG